MNPSKLTEVIDIYRPVIVQTQYGEQETLYNKIYTCRAYVSWNSGSRDLENQEVVFNYRKTVQIYNYVDVNELD